MTMNVTHAPDSGVTNTTESSADVVPDFPRWGYTLMGFVLMCVGILGILENATGLYVFVRNKQLRSPTNIFIIGVIVSDFSMAVFGNPLATINALNGTWFAGSFWCNWEGFVVYFLGMAALYLLTAVSVDRYIVITKPLMAAKVTRRVATITVLASYGAGFLWALFPFFGWSSYGVELSGFYCGLHYSDKSLSNTTYIIAIFFFCFLFPMGVMMYCYYHVYMTVRHISRNTVWDASSRLARKNMRIERKMLKTCLLMCLVYWVCWFPYAIVSFWQTFGDVADIPIVWSAVPAVAAKSQIVWNPVIYVATNKQFRTAFYDSLPCGGLRDALVKREEVKEAESKVSELGDDKKKEDESKTKRPVTEEKKKGDESEKMDDGSTAATGPVKVEC